VRAGSGAAAEGSAPLLTCCGCYVSWQSTGTSPGRFAGGSCCRWSTWALPIDPIPDVMPVLGYADGAIIVTLVLRSVVRRAGLDAVRRD
jgi:hypothetical protein